MRVCNLLSLLALLLASLTPATSGLTCLSVSSAHLTITGPARNASACTATATALNANRQLRANGVSFLRAFRCDSCAPLPKPGGNGTSGANHITSDGNGCLASITAVLKPMSLAQWYANAWAVPKQGVYVTSNLLKRIVRSNPTCRGNAPCQDLLPAALATTLGGGCMDVTTYYDSCGGQATSPYNCSNGNTTNTTNTTSPSSTTTPRPATPLFTPVQQPSPAPSPSPKLPACSLYISTMTRNITTCRSYLAQLGMNPTYVTALASRPIFTGCTCMTGASGAPGPCSINVTGAFSSLSDLLQFYANAGAIPYGTNSNQPLSLPNSQGGMPSMPGTDFFQQGWAMDGFDVACGHSVSYHDTCGSEGRQPLHFDCASPPSSPPPPSPSIAATPATCTLTITAPSNDLTRCASFATELSTSTMYTAGVARPPTFSGCECDSEQNFGTCYVALKGTFFSQADLLQFYANAGAYPSNTSTNQPIPLPPSKGGLPTANGYDQFQSVSGRVSTGLGFVCGQSIFYEDTCGGYGAQPMHGDCLMPPWPPSPSVPPSPPSPPPSPPFPPIRPNTKPACTLTVSSPTTSLAACHAFMSQVVHNASYVTGLWAPPQFTGCAACHSGSEAQGNCLVTLTGRFLTPADLLQFYSNAGARPVSNSTLQPLGLPPPKLQSSSSQAGYDDLFQEAVLQGLGSGCGGQVSYVDTCGGLTGLPLYTIDCPTPAPTKSSLRGRL